MNKLKQQTILLIALMVFLSTATVFLLHNTPSNTSSSELNIEENRTISDQIEEVEVEKPEGDSLVAQSQRGLIALYRDFQFGVELFLGSDEEIEDYENETRDGETENEE